MPKLGKAMYWDEESQQWKSYYPYTLAVGVKDPNFTKPVTNPETGDTEQKAMTQGEINLQFRDEKQDYSGLHIVDNKLCMYAPAPTTQSDNN